MESALGFIFFFIFFLIVGLAIGAGLLMLATRIAGVPVPSFGRAVVIVIIAGLANMAASFVLGLVVGFAMGSQLEQNPEAAGLIVNSLGLLVGLFVNSWIYSAMLPTSYVKGLIVYIIQFAIIMAIVISVVMIIMLVGGSVAFLNN